MSDRNQAGATGLEAGQQEMPSPHESRLLGMLLTLDWQIAGTGDCLLPAVSTYSDAASKGVRSWIEAGRRAGTLFFH